MSEATDRLREDLKILTAMTADMSDYLDSQTLFWPLPDAHMPRLTLGGYLMRQHRLSNLRFLLDPVQQAELDRAIAHYNEALVEKIVRLEQHAHDELHARLRQWSEYLRELCRESVVAADFYPSSVQTRAMIAALLDQLTMPPYELDKRVLDELQAYDNALRNYWHPDDFIWPDEWKPAYPKSKYWWLYGHPRCAD